MKKVGVGGAFTLSSGWSVVSVLQPGKRKVGNLIFSPFIALPFMMIKRNTIFWYLLIKTPRVDDLNGLLTSLISSSAILRVMAIYMC